MEHHASCGQYANTFQRLSFKQPGLINGQSLNNPVGLTSCSFFFSALSSLDDFFSSPVTDFTSLGSSSFAFDPAKRFLQKIFFTTNYRLGQFRRCYPPPFFWPLGSPAQTVRDSKLKFFMEGHLWTTTGVVQAIFRFPPLSRAMGG